jgi:hypothetical protein
VDDERREELRDLGDRLKVVGKDLSYLGDSLRGAAIATLPLIKRLAEAVASTARVSVERYDAMTEDERAQLTPSIRQFYESMREAVHASDEAEAHRPANE